MKITLYVGRASADDASWGFVTTKHSEAMEWAQSELRAGFGAAGLTDISVRSYELEGPADQVICRAAVIAQFGGDVVLAMLSPSPALEGAEGAHTPQVTMKVGTQWARTPNRKSGGDA